MSNYTITALTDSYDLKPEGDGYAPQIIFTRNNYGWNITELNTESLPFNSDYVETVIHDLSVRDLPDGSVERFFKIFYDLEVIRKDTHGYSQGDWGVSYVFGTPEFYELTGAPGIQESDHNDLCAWIWGDVYEVSSATVTKNEVCSLGHVHSTVIEEPGLVAYIYGMDEATKFANENNIEIEGL